jgi:uncharacterized membrane protein required for colicin V production
MPSSLAALQPFLVDGLLALALLYFTVTGYRRGIVQTIGQLLGTVLGFWIAKTWALPIANTVGLVVPLSSAVIQIIVFILIFIVADRLVGLVFWLLDKIFKIVTLLPFLSTVDSLLGGVVGLFQGVFLIGSLSYIILTLRLNPAWMAWISDSRIASFSQTVFYRLLGFLV